MSNQEDMDKVICLLVDILDKVNGLSNTKGLPELITKKDLATYLRVDLSTINKLQNADALPSCIRVGRKVYFDINELSNYIKNGKNK